MGNWQYQVTLNPNTMNLTEAKDQIAQRMGFSNWKRFEIYVKPTPEIMDEAMKLYASEKVKEVLQLAAEKVTYRESRSGQHSTTILSLETELIENIKKEK